MQQTITFILYCVIIGVAMASQKTAEQTRPKRVRRGLINVQKQTDELNRLTNEFGEGAERELEGEDWDAVLGEDMSFSFEELSYSYEYSKSKKGKKSRRV